MKILFSSYVFAPSIGGIENVGLNLANHMRLKGHDVTVMTDTPGPPTIESIPVVRNPSSKTIKELIERSEAVFGNHLSLRLLKPLLTNPKKPHCILLHTHLQKKQPHRMLSSILTARKKTFAVSHFLAEAHRLGNKVFYNGFDSNIFSHSPKPYQSRDIDFLFVGRIVSDKGIDLLVDAMHKFPSNNCTVVGEGPDRKSLSNKAHKNTHFTGSLAHTEIADLMRRSKWVVVPSRWKEPFGLVAIESIACGSEVIAANHGGLPEAVGPCGRLFHPNDQNSLENEMSEALKASSVSFSEEERSIHLSQFSYEKQTAQILKMLVNN